MKVAYHYKHHHAQAQGACLLTLEVPEHYLTSGVHGVPLVAHPDAAKASHVRPDHLRTPHGPS